MRYSLLKARLADFLHSRHMTRHFQRLLLPNKTALSRKDNTERQHAGLLLEAAYASPDTVLHHLNSNVIGLSDNHADAVRKQAGLNELAHEASLHWWQHLWLCYRNPFNLLLTLLATVSWLTEDTQATLVIGTMVVLSTLLRFWQEGKSNRAADALKALVSTTASVRRPALTVDVNDTKLFNVVEIPMAQLVPGDIVVLAAGDMIPADCRVLQAKDLFVAQAAMTGESMPVEKRAIQDSPDTSNPLELDNIVFMGTNVVSGTAVVAVISTGRHTYFGALASRVTATDSTPTAFQAGVNKVSWLLIRFMYVMAPLVFLINGLTKGDWMEALLFALSVAVGLTPEMLPMIVTSTLAKGAVFLSRKKVIVKRLDAIQSFGAMDVLCTDKTGTLTEDHIVLARHLDVWGEDSDRVLEMAYLNSYYQTGLKNLLDKAVLEHTEVHWALAPNTHYRKVDEIPFDFERRRMSVVVSERDDHHELICKGAVEEILAVCSHVQHSDAIEPLTPDLLARIKHITDELNGEGLRVVAVAAKEAPPSKDVYSQADESELTLMGYVAFLDPPKASTAPALQALADHGVAVKVLTGDNDRVAAKVCRDVGLAHANEVVLGSDIDSMDDAALAKTVERHTLFAKLTPAHKERVVGSLKESGHVVGFMGDGINDAPALRRADIGISVDTAVDIAKEAADIILLEKSLMVLEEGIQEGRRTFTNMLKYIKMTASSNFGNVFSVLVASVFIPFLPMLPMHLLVQNLLYDISQTATPFDNVDEAQLKAPQRWQPTDIGRFMLFFGPISSVFDILTFFMMWYLFGANTPAHQTLFQSGWFVVGLLTQTLVIHMIRTAKVPFIQSRAAWPVLVMTGLIMIIGVWLPTGPLASYFKLQPLPATYFICLPLILAAYMALTQAMKRLYVRRYGWQ